MTLSKGARIAVSITIALVLAVIALVLITVAPYWLMMEWYGAENVYNSPAHGGAIFFISLPVAGSASIPIIALLPRWIYRKWFRTPHANQ